MDFILEMHRLQFSWPIPISDFWKCDLPIPIFADSDFLYKNYNWQYIETKIYANFNAKIIYIIKLIIKNYNSPNLD